MEVLRHRNKNQGPCLNDWMNYDDMVIKKHHNNIGCSPPYQKSNKPICTKRNEMNASSYLLSEINNGDYPIPCKEMSKFRIDSKETSAVTDLQFDFTYPSRIKVIQQIKSVDIQSLIGNIGGYIGLFLGYALIQLPEALLSIYMQLKKHFDNNDTSDKPNAIIDIQMINRESSMKPPSDKVNPYIIDVVQKIEKNLETLGQRMDMIESKISY